MSQYKLGRVNVTNGSNVVAGVSGATFVGDVASGHRFSIRNSGVWYTVAAAPTVSGQLSITPPYAGVTAANLEYEIIRDFTPRGKLPKPTNNDNDTSLIMSWVLDQLDDHFYASGVTPISETWADGRYLKKLDPPPYNSTYITRAEAPPYDSTYFKRTETPFDGRYILRTDAPPYDTTYVKKADPPPYNSTYVTRAEAPPYDATYVRRDAPPPGAPTFARNIIPAGDFSLNPWQRGTGWSPAANGQWGPDRFQYTKAGTMTHAYFQGGAPLTAAQAGLYCWINLGLQCTTAQPTMGANQACSIHHPIEGYMFARIAHRPFTLSFWHRHTKTGVYNVAFRNSGNDRSYIAEYTQDVSYEWEKAVITVPASPEAGTWNYTTGIGLMVTWIVAAGPTWQGPANQWLTGNYVSTVNQVNNCDALNNYFTLQLVALEEGGGSPSFDRRSVEEVLEHCQRYYEKSYAGTTPAGTGGGAGYNTAAAGNTGAGAANSVCVPVPYRVRKRTTPTVTAYNANSGAAGQGIDGGGLGVNVSVVGSGEYGCTVINTGTANPNTAFYVAWAAHAELM